MTITNNAYKHTHTCRIFTHSTSYTDSSSMQATYGLMTNTNNNWKAIWRNNATCCMRRVTSSCRSFYFFAAHMCRWHTAKLASFRKTEMVDHITYTEKSAGSDDWERDFVSRSQVYVKYKYTVNIYILYDVHECMIVWEATFFITHYDICLHRFIQIYYAMQTIYDYLFIYLWRNWEFVLKWYIWTTSVRRLMWVEVETKSFDSNYKCFSWPPRRFFIVILLPDIVNSPDRYEYFVLEGPVTRE